ncbi:unnamed protein product [Musa acuminata subsp. malaccensis]|uniref:(wild Malaysian banana) hypothetical protein n=1 Tax=Musa acuminata subsp. malaccensis TaxID=214687 RepID=A0A804KL64_MUSAM|nr:unnamed protein product [Musa acuminata subsp. malaccensis]
MNKSARIISASEVNGGYFTPYQSSFCLDSSLNTTKARGKILICRHSGSAAEPRLEKSLVVQKAGGLGMVMIDEAENDVAIPFAIPTATVRKEIGNKIFSYVNHTRKPSTLILPVETVLGSRPAPRVAAFSSKGPNSLTAEVLKVGSCVFRLKNVIEPEKQYIYIYICVYVRLLSVVDIIVHFVYFLFLKRTIKTTID